MTDQVGAGWGAKGFAELVVGGRGELDAAVEGDGGAGGRDGDRRGRLGDRDGRRCWRGREAAGIGEGDLERVVAGGGEGGGGVLGGVGCRWR